MKSKYIHRLTDEELLELHRYTVCDDTNDVISDDRCSYYQEISFMENWPEEDGSASYVETNYRYTDFEPPYCYDTSADPSEKSKFYLWMVARFGKDYIKDYLVYHGFRRDCIESALEG